MLAADAPHMQVAELANAAVIALGVILGCGFVIRLIRRGEWRDPLAGVRGTARGPSLVQLCEIVLAYVVLAVVFGLALERIFKPDPAAEPGTQRWHLAVLADSAAKLCAAAVAVYVLYFRLAPPVARRRSLAGVTAVGVLAGVILIAVCTLQLSTMTILWQWINPTQRPPLHDVLVAFWQSEWGVWGQVQLFVTAVVVAATVEELLFRGLLLQTIWRYSQRAWLAIALSALAFGFMHFTQPQGILPLATMGVVLGYVRLRTGSLAACVIAHAFFNARTMVLATFFPELLEAAG